MDTASSEDVLSQWRRSLPSLPPHLQLPGAGDEQQKNLPPSHSLSPQVGGDNDDDIDDIDDIDDNDNIDDNDDT